MSHNLGIDPTTLQAMEECLYLVDEKLKKQQITLQGLIDGSQKLDSIDVVAFAAELETRFGLRIPNADVISHGLDQPSNLLRYVNERKTRTH